MLMKSMFVASGVLVASACLAAAPTDVYLLIGQSNMAGRGDVSVEKVDNSRLLKWGDSDAIEVRNLFAYK